MNYRKITLNQTAKMKRRVDMSNSQAYANAVKGPEDITQSSVKDKYKRLM